MKNYKLVIFATFAALALNDRHAYLLNFQHACN